MERIRREKDNWGQYVIFVEKCKKYEYEVQADMPALNKREGVHNVGRFENKRLIDIIRLRENYF